MTAAATLGLASQATAGASRLDAAADTVQHDWSRFARDSGPGGSAADACTMLTAGVFTKYLHNVAGGPHNTLPRTCEAAITDNQYRVTHLPQVNGCHRRAFTARQVAAYAAYAQAHLTVSPLSATDVHVTLGEQNPQFADVSQTEVWLLQRGHWVQTSGWPPLFNPPC